jgi:tetratricopeptide (TPR) repeat protein
MWEEAQDLYGRAVNALPDDVKALSNRSATWAQLRRFQDALLDADMALQYAPLPPPWRAREGLSHM